ncbi:unnamed protein product [Meloidogyne enterolobii]|uniref:Uncharacterized protein n=1 Tax=Meloidogyne enterolobii TaxID=390850 RepID=A0ACB1AQA4_MELEN
MLLKELELRATFTSQVNYLGNSMLNVTNVAILVSATERDGTQGKQPSQVVFEKVAFICNNLGTNNLMEKVFFFIKILDFFRTKLTFHGTTPLSLPVFADFFADIFSFCSLYIVRLPSPFPCQAIKRLNLVNKR